MQRPRTLRGAEQTPSAHLLDDQIGSLLSRHLLSVDAQLRRLRRLVRRVDTSEILQLTTARLAVQALDVPPLRLGQRRIDEDFEELTLGE